MPLQPCSTWASRRLFGKAAGSKKGRSSSSASRRLLLSIFLDPATDAASIAQGADFLSVMGFAYIIAAVMNSYLNVLRGAGDVNVSLVAGLFEMGPGWRLPLCWRRTWVCGASGLPPR